MRALILLALTMTTLRAEDRWQARSMTISQRGIVATSQTLASQAGAQILARGGNAVDAAIAANAVLGVVEPMMNGMGGDLFAIVRDPKSGRLTGINASGWAPKALTVDLLRSRGHSMMPDDGILSVTVPGCVDGWEKLHKKFGRLPWADLFKPAIFYAKNGFPLTELIHSGWKATYGKLYADENARRVYLPGGMTPKLGQIFRNPELARAYELIAIEGAAAFYRGGIGKALLKTSNRLRGVMTAADLSEFQSEWVEPASTDYHGWKVYELPPNGQGIAVLQMLNLLERYPLSSMDPRSADAFHYKIEAQKLAYADLQRWVGDPKFSKQPVAELISKPYADKRAELIKPDKAACQQPAGNPLPSTGDTIYLSTVDKDGMVVSLIQSIYLSWGSGIVVDDFGFHLHNRGGLFVLDDGHPNRLEPRKRPFHTIIPAYMEKGNEHVGFGIMGGLNQSQAHAQFVSYVVDHGMNLQGALEAPRFTKMNFGGCDVRLESRLPGRTLRTLRDRGHILQMTGEFSSWMGGGQAVMHNSKTKVNYGASSPRKDGAAIPEPDKYF
jgi:gamma-glutamyltranspeptidase/glutathione hydrolase